MIRRAPPAAPADAPPVLLDLALPGGTRFVGRLHDDGCTPWPDGAPAPDGARLLLWDGRDLRLSRGAAIGRREARHHAAEANPDADWRFVRSADRSVVYARAADDLPATGAGTPLLLALDLLDDARRPGPLAVVLGPPDRADVVIIVGRDGDGRLDGDRLQVWLRPQDPVAVLLRDCASATGTPRPDAWSDGWGGAGTAPGDAPRRSAEMATPQRDPADDPTVPFDAADLLAVARRMPVYAVAADVLGRTPAEWARLANRPLALAAVLTLGWALHAGWAWSAASRQHDEAQAAATRARAALAVRAAAAPTTLARAASLDARALVEAARAIWRPGAQVRIAAGDDAIALTAVLPLPAEGSAALPAPPRGFAAAAVALSSDQHHVVVRHVAPVARPVAARLLGG